MHELYTDPADEPTGPIDNGNRERPQRNDVLGRLSRLERQQDTTHGEYVAILKAIGGLHSMVEKDQAERRTAKWMQAPVWLAVFAWMAIAAAVVWAAYRSNGAP
jgi:hypothetical protein